MLFVGFISYHTLQGFISKNKLTYHLIKIPFKAEAYFVPYCSTI